MVQWNLAQFATALIAAGLVPQEAAQTVVNGYAERVVALHDEGMAAKLGLAIPSEDLVRCSSPLRSLAALALSEALTERARADDGFSAAAVRG